jgi:hypothetical protein
MRGYYWARYEDSTFKIFKATHIVCDTCPAGRLSNSFPRLLGGSVVQGSTWSTGVYTVYWCNSINAVYFDSLVVDFSISFNWKFIKVVRSNSLADGKVENWSPSNFFNFYYRNGMIVIGVDNWTSKQWLIQDYPVAVTHTEWYATNDLWCTSLRKAKPQLKLSFDSCLWCDKFNEMPSSYQRWVETY